MALGTSSPEVTVVGYLSLDEIVCPAGRFESVPGGAAYYCAAGAALAGAKVRLIARVAEEYPHEALSVLAALGVSLAGVERVAGPARRSRLHDPTGRDRTLAHLTEAAWWEATERLKPPRPPDGCGLYVFTAMPAEYLEQQIRWRTPGDLLLADTSGAYARREASALLALLPRLDVFAPSREETQLLLPGLEDDAALDHLATLVPCVLQKRGPDGLALKRSGQPTVTVPSRATHVVDTTGAGDSVVGALSAALAAGLEDSQALAIASAIAAAAVAGVGSEGLVRR